VVSSQKCYTPRALRRAAASRCRTTRLKAEEDSTAQEQSQHQGVSHSKIRYVAQHEPGAGSGRSTAPGRGIVVASRSKKAESMPRRTKKGKNILGKRKKG